jgi:hypothetical protein
MDPYLALGVRRGCSRAEAKAAFRARAWYAHPDRGGEDADFVRLSAAYNQIIAELPQFPSSGTHDPDRPSPGARAAASSPAGGADNHRASARAASQNRARKPADPAWKPDMIIADEQPCRRRPTKPRDPNWSPEFVMVDESPRAAFAGVSPDPRVGPTRLDRWCRRFPYMFSTAREDSFLQSDSGRFWGTLLLLVAIAVCLWWACWVAWNLEPADTAPGLSTSSPYRK